MDLRTLGTTGIRVSPISLGCWPIAGMTSSGVNDADSLATLRACFELGINFLDTAYCYGAAGESERLIAQAISGRRDEMVIATKGGIHWGPGRKQIVDGSPATIERECEASLARLNTDRVELYYLHAPDPQVPIAESAAAIAELLKAGKILSAGLSNATIAQMTEFAAVCPLTAYQPAYNMLQRNIEAETLPWCQRNQVSVLVYWPLLKGLLTGKFSRDHEFPEGDSRRKYPMFQGQEWQKNQDFVDDLRPIARDTGHSVAQMVVNWTIHRPGITGAICGAIRPEQIRDNAGALGWSLTPDQLNRIDAALQRRGSPVTKGPV